MDLDLRITRKTVQQEVVDKLRQAILSGTFAPGHRLVEADLCEALGVSRSSLREALRGLQAEHLIEIIPNRGPHIPVLTWEDAEEIYEVRELLEGEAALRCAARMSDDDIAELAERLETFHRAARDENADDLADAAAAFYELILSRCGNKIIQQMLAGLLARISYLRKRSMSLPGRALKSHEEMRAIHQAIADRNTRDARKAAMKHVSNARASAKQTFPV
ncbi:GntR family transcriptional regulator [Pseudohoeflea suaedae]|uniref:GntR family transcriptional regulator n=1 Tax=Pseudohoeflea suaedae TaxID=877384 RepID=A0A4R5PN11_9HYPH|nr:GntR family transcriptional regulator [Pseudohoeflea suaedae]TDH38424.1 GntR family transcriptional regulator [Pseudohoeflea suaedae]